MNDRILTALPVYNEAKHVPHVLDQVLQHADDILVVNDGSTDNTKAALDFTRELTQASLRSVLRHIRSALASSAISCQ